MKRSICVQLAFDDDNATVDVRDKDYRDGNRNR